MNTITPALAGLTVLFVPCLQAQSIVLEPDNYANGTVLDHVLPQVSLITAGMNNLPHQPAPFSVTAATSTFPFQPPTGSNVFAHVGIPFWNDDRRLRMDFSGLVSTISIDFQGGNSLVTERGRLEAYDQNGSLLATYLTQPVLGGQIESMSIARPGSDIAWAVAYTIPGASVFGRLDHLTFSPPVPVPEPGTIILFATALAIGFTRWRMR